RWPQSSSRSGAWRPATGRLKSSRTLEPMRHRLRSAWEDDRVKEPTNDTDVIVIGGGPAGSALATLLARDGRDVILLEKDVHPRDHVGESLTPSTNLVFKEMGFLDKMNDAGFIHKPGTGWNAPRSALWKFVEIWLFEYPIPNGPQPYTYNVERDVMDTMLIRHA